MVKAVPLVKGIPGSQNSVVDYGRNTPEAKYMKGP
jgi:hypothetical protein